MSNRIQGWAAIGRRPGSRRAALACIALPIWLAVTAAAPSDPVAVPRTSLEQRLQAGIAASERHDCVEADGLLRRLTKSDSEASDGLKRFVLTMLVSCRAQAGQYEPAYPDALAGTAIDGGDDYLWRMRLFLEVETNRADAAVATVEAIPAAAPSLLSQLDPSFFFRIDEQLKSRSESGLREHLLKILLSDAYLPEDGSPEKDGFRILYARLLVGRPGVEAELRARMAELKSPYWLRQASVDPSLRALLAADPDIRAATEAKLARDREAAAAHPDLLRWLVFAADDLRALGRPGEALSLLQGVAARVNDAKAFADRDRYLTWWWDGVARSEEALGHYDAAAAAFRQGMGIAEDGQPNVSQVINLAVLQTRFGHASEALKTLAAFDDPKRKGSPYGEMMLRENRGCAEAVLGDKQAAAADLAYARAHEKDAPGGLADLLLCLGDVDGAAAITIRRLADPDQRASALVDLSDYDQPAVRLPPPATEPAYGAMMARPDVKAAIARAGGTRRFNVLADEI